MTNGNFSATPDLLTVVNRGDRIAFGAFLQIRNDSSQTCQPLRPARSRHQWSAGIILALGLIGIVATPPATAQITPDQTLGNESSHVTPNVTIRGANADRIDGGAVRGSNLFHSFLELNVNEGQRVYFANPAGVANILSRVTGNTRSDVMGTLGVDGGANLFLLNPNGIIFGPNARLDVSGSFTASTANGFTFPDGGQFSATNPGDSSLLSVAVPLGVQYGSVPPGAIANAGNLSVGQNLSLSGGSVTSTGQLSAPSGQLWVEGVAGDVQVRQAAAQMATLSASNNLILRESQLQTAGDLNLLAGNTVQIRDSVANPFVADAGGNLTVQGNQGIDIFALNHPSSGLVSSGDMVLRSANTVGGDAHYWTGGSFQIEQLNGNPGNLFSPYDPIIRSSGDVVFGDYIGASLHIFAGGSVTANNITITGVEISPANSVSENVILSNVPFIPPADQSILIDGSAQPTLDIRAGITDDLSLLTPPLTPNVGFPGTGNSISPNPPGTPGGSGSSITIGSITNRSIGGSGQILLTNLYRSTGSVPGVIQINGVIPDQGSTLAPSILDDQSISAYGSGVTIAASGNVRIANGVITGTSAIPGSSAFGGDITIYSGATINTGNLQSQVDIGSGGSITLRAGREIDTTRGALGSFSLGGLAGDVTLEAPSNIHVGNITASSADSSNLGGTVTININSTQGSVFLDGSTISATNSGSNFAGDIFIDARDRIRIINNSTVSSEGNFGRIFIGASSEQPSQTNPPEAILIDSSKVSTTNRDSGFAGDIFIDARDRIRIINNSTVSSNGQGGRIFVGVSSDVTNPRSPNFDRSSPNRIIFEGNSTLSTDNIDIVNSGDPRNFRNAGDVFIRASDRIALTNSSIQSDTSRRGDSGSITITAENDFNINNGFVSSQVLRGGVSRGSGFITINAGSLQLVNGGQIDTFLNNVRNSGSAPQGVAGNVTINVRDDINIGNGNIPSGQVSNSDFSGIFSTVGNGGIEPAIGSPSNPYDPNLYAGNSTAISSGGRIRITSGSLSISGTGSTDDMFGGNAGIAAKTFGFGDAGNIFITTGSLSISNGGFLDNSTTRVVSRGIAVNGSGNAGDITVEANSITLANGNLNRRAIQTTSFRSSTSDTSRSNINASAGSINIFADRLRLNASSIDASTRGSNEGNITIQRLNGQPISLILLRNQSQISAEAFGNPNGGNVTINDRDHAGGFVLATPDNNDIIASARQGAGGRIEVNSFAIFGLEERNPVTPLSDFNASSQFSTSGVVLLNTLNVDPTRGLGELPIDLVNPADLVADGCVGRNRSGVTDQGEFTQTGRGGLSPNPGDPLNSEPATDQLATLDPNQTPSGSASIPDVPQVQSLVEAQGLALNPQGKVSLVSTSSTTTSPAIEQPPACIAP